MLRKIIRKVKRKLKILESYPSETSKVRHLVLDYCIGNGCDIGFGGDKIKKDNCIGIDYAQPYAFTGKDKVDIVCDLLKEKIPVAESTFDYVYSSHLIEDFENTKEVLEDFIRILKNDGNLVLVFPDQRVYENYCIKTGQPLNTYHIHKEMGLDFMLNVLNQIKYLKYQVLFASNCEVDYNVILVIKINKHGNH